MFKATLTISALLFSYCLMAQQYIPINNFSFEEGIAAPGKRNTEIPGWIDCGLKSETAPDVHNELSDFHKVKHSAAHGFNYLMMVTRDNDTQEMIGAPLREKLLKDSNYVLSVHLAKPATCISRSKKMAIDMEYNKGVILRIFGGTKACNLYQLLAESPVIEDVDWNEHQFLLLPKKNFDFLFLQAYYSDEAQEPYNGSILLDNIKLFSRGTQHQAMHTVIASDKQYAWPNVLKIDETIAEIVPEGLEKFPGNGEQAGLFHVNYESLVFQYELLSFEQFFSRRNKLVDFIKQTEPERIALTIKALRHIHAHQTAKIIDEMFSYFQLYQTSAITETKAKYQMNKLEAAFEEVIDSDEVFVKRIRHVIAHREKYLVEIRMAMIDLLGGRDVLNFAKKNP